MLCFRTFIRREAFTDQLHLSNNCKDEICMAEINLFVSFIRQRFWTEHSHLLHVACCNSRSWSYMIKTLSDANICPNQDRTISGKLCQKWNKDFPHVTKLSTISNVLKKTGSLDHNNCVYGLVSNDPRMAVIFMPHKLCKCFSCDCDQSKTLLLHNWPEHSLGILWL